MAGTTIKHPMAKRFMVVFGSVLVLGIVVQSVQKSDFGEWVLVIGIVGLLASALIAREKTTGSVSSTPESRSARKTDNAATEETNEQGQTKFGRRRFSPGSYGLDLSKVKDMPLQMNGQPSTFGEVYRRLKDSEIRETQTSLQDTYVTEDGEVRLDGEIAEWPLRATMRGLIELIREGVDPYGVTWFYYGHDWSIDADESYDFFAVHKNKIVSESCAFSSEEPFIFKQQKKADEHVWRSHEYFSEALELYWYRKFYTETMTGQLMVLRPDEPILYHYERPSLPITASTAHEEEVTKTGSKSKIMQWLSLYVVSMLIGLYTAFVFMVMWNWFVAQTLNFHELSFWQALGLFWLVGLLKGTPGEQGFTSKNRWDTLFMVLDYCVPGEKLQTLKEQIKEKTESMWTDALAETFGHAVGITVTLGLGWLVHSLAA